MNPDLLWTVPRVALTAAALAVLYGWHTRAWNTHHRHSTAYPTIRWELDGGQKAREYALVTYGQAGIIAADILTAALIVVPVVLNPYAHGAIGAAFLIAGVYGWRHLHGDDDVNELTAALADVMGTKPGAKDTPRVQPSQREHPHGGPLQLTVTPRPGWRHFDKEAEPKLARAINGIMDGDWELKRKERHGRTVWERKAVLPPRVPYPRGNDLPWHRIPAGVTGHGDPATIDLLIHPHVLVAGNTGSGKTSFFRAAAVHFLSHGVPIEALDIQGLGFAFLEYRPGVTTSMDWDTIQQRVTRLRGYVHELEAWKRRTNKTPPPHVVMIDELARLITHAQAVQKAVNGLPPLVLDLLDLANTGRKVHVFLFASITRPDTAMIPGIMRDQFDWRLAVGRLRPDGARMMLDDDWKRSAEMRQLPGSAVLLGGGRLLDVQLPEVADPNDPLHPAAARHEAEGLLPPAEVQEAVTGASEESPPTLTRGAQLAVGSEVASAVPEPPQAPPVEDPHARALRLKREGQRRRRAELKVALGDPDHPRHGTPDAVNIGCRCPRVSPCPLVTREGD